MRQTRSEDHGKTTTLDFRDLERLRLFSREILRFQTASLKYFEYDAGFQHYRGKLPPKISVSSSATCVLSLVAAGCWKSNEAQTKKLLHDLLLKNTSAGLPSRNSFTIAWILEAVTTLESFSDPLDDADIELIGRMERLLQRVVANGKGGVKIADYPPSAYLTQLVVRVLDKRSKLNDKLRDLAGKWAWAELTRQMALVQAKSKTADAFAVAYLLMIVGITTPNPKTTPEQTSTKRSALDTFFECQRKDGTWPLSRPLFHYRKFGNAYCYEYEMLTQLLQRHELWDLMLEHLPELRSAVDSVSSNVYDLEDGVKVWTSGHHPQQAKPESWATASVYHFLYEFDRLLAEAVRRRLFEYLELPLPAPVKEPDFVSDFVDSQLNVRSQPYSLKRFLLERFVKLLAPEADEIGKGRSFKKGTPRSAIFFGPPGTSKTELCKGIARYIGWPYLAVDPSFLLRNGMDGIQAEANTIFRMLEETERVVVLFDEFDEFVREREFSDGEQFSRLLTTAMLPKLASIHKRGTLIFIIATNNIRIFDLAIQRPGRFDRVVQIMPPTYDAKLEKTNWGIKENVDIGKKLRELGLHPSEQTKERLGDLIYLECDNFATDLAKATTPTEAMETLEDHWKGCILQAINKNEKLTWKECCKKEEQFNR
jgi:transcription termination factor NusB